MVSKQLIGITGGAGYLGSSLARYLSESFAVKLLDIKPPRSEVEGSDFQVCDITNFGEVEKSLEDADLVIHAAIVQIPVINEQKRLGYEVNFLGTQNVCRAVDENPNTKGLILAGSWHTVGERELMGIIDEEFGFRPDKVEDRARLYALSKIGQESIVRFYDEVSEKVFGIIRMGTVLGEGMHEKTAANTFIENGINSKPLTPYKHSMFRPMLYVDIDDVCRAYKNFAQKILDNKISKQGNSLAHIVNVCYPQPITVFELAKTVKDAIFKCSEGFIEPKINVVDTLQRSLFSENDEKLIEIDVSKALSFLNLGKLKSPRESIEGIVRTSIESKKIEKAYV